MPGCCLLAVLFFLGPRVLLACAWLFTGWYQAFSSSLLALAGFLFLPWTSLAWMLVFFHNQGELSGGYGLVLVAGVLLDLSTYGGSHQARRRRRDD